MGVTDGRRDTGLGTSKLAAFFGSTAGTVIFWCGFLVLILLLVFAVLFPMYRSQSKKLDELEQQRIQLEERVDELSREKELMESKLKYISSLEGLLNYARENLGYIDPGDTRYDDNGGN